MTTINIPHGARQIIEKLSVRGFEAYVVGGCVRDSLLGLAPHDWDICTNAVPTDILVCFSDKKVIETGLKHGTVTVVMDDGTYEITTYRIDGDYTDGRHPDGVTFSNSLTEDLSRRDFTMNAIAYNDVSGLVDPFDGVSAIVQHRIECVGKPYDRFNEDALRILRAIRFASVYRFSLDYYTEQAACSLQHNLNKISAERIQSELCKLLTGENVSRILLYHANIICTIIPEFTDCIGFEQNNPYHQYTVYEHIARSLSFAAGKEIPVRLALLLHDIGKPHCYTEVYGVGHFHGHAKISRDIADTVLDRLRFDNSTKKAVLELIQYHDDELIPTPKAIRRWLNKIGEERLHQLIQVKRADCLAQSGYRLEERMAEFEQAESILNDVLKDNQCFSMKNLTINGKDVLSLGVSEGKTVGYILKTLLEKVVDGELENDKLTLISAAKALIANEGGSYHEA